ncbi:MAG: Co2+/Mg2+ efflux protein ApaG [Planctomycetota bacterium]
MSDPFGIRGLPGTSSATTRGVRVEVLAQYVPSHSAPAEQRFFFAYRVRIKNEGDEPVQLVSRHWVITDAAGRVEHVRGPGVVGEQPRLLPGEEHEYTSFCPLPTTSGSMRGSYRMLKDDGSAFDAEVATFSLLVPQLLN